MRVRVCVCVRVRAGTHKHYSARAHLPTLERVEVAVRVRRRGVPRAHRQACRHRTAERIVRTAAPESAEQVACDLLPQVATEYDMPQRWMCNAMLPW